MKKNEYFDSELDATVSYSKENGGYIYKNNKGVELPFRVVLNKMFLETALIQQAKALTRKAVKYIDAVKLEQDANQTHKKYATQKRTLAGSDLLTKAVSLRHKIHNMDVFIKKHLPCPSKQE